MAQLIDGGSMRLLSVLALLTVFFVCSSGSAGQKPSAGADCKLRCFGLGFLPWIDITDCKDVLRIS